MSEDEKDERTLGVMRVCAEILRKEGISVRLILNKGVVVIGSDLDCRPRIEEVLRQEFGKNKLGITEIPLIEEP